VADVPPGSGHQAPPTSETPSRRPSLDGSEVVCGPSPPQAVSVTRVGNLRWTELQVFSVVGSWVVSTPGHEGRVVLAGVSRHAAWRAALLADRLPRVGALAVDVVTMPRDDGLVAVVEQLAAVDSTADRLAVLGDVVLGGLASAASALLATLSPVADAPLLRALPMVIDDLNRDRAVVSGLVVGLDGGTGSPTVAAVATALDGAGGW